MGVSVRKQMVSERVRKKIKIPHHSDPRTNSKQGAILSCQMTMTSDHNLHQILLWNLLEVLGRFFLILIYPKFAIPL
jgi:hypothetical protein